jgi:hypothetical protein
VTNKDEVLKRIRAEGFFENNGEVMRALNIEYIKYHPLKLVCKALLNGCGMSEMDFLKSVNYLQMKGYILIRNIKTKEETEIADAEYAELEAKLSDDGVDVSSGIIMDKAVPM